MGPVKRRRQIAAQDTQRAIVDAAAHLFLERGYRATPITEIALEAGVAVQTIYNSIGSKRELLSRVLDHMAAGDRAPVPVATFMREQAEREPDPRRIVEQMVEFWVGSHERTAPIFRIIREAAALDPEIAELERQRAEQRLRNYRQAARLLAERGALRDGLGEEEAAATMFALGHPDVYRLLVSEGGWTPERWASWVGAALLGALLGED